MRFQYHTGSIKRSGKFVQDAVFQYHTGSIKSNVRKSGVVEKCFNTTLVQLKERANVHRHRQLYVYVSIPHWFN
jgi:hypothetical protein